MAIGKGSKKKKGGRKKAVDPMSRKDWVQLIIASYKSGALRPFNSEAQKSFLGNWTVVNRTQGTKIAANNLMGRQFEIRADDRGRDMSCTEQHQAETGTINNFVVKYKIVAVKDDEKGCVCLPCGVRPTKGYLGSQMKKRHTTIDTCVDIVTSDGYKIRVMVKAITKKQQHSIKVSAYAKSSQVKLIRDKLKEAIKTHCSSKTLSDIVNDMVSGRSLADSLEQSTLSLYPLNPEFMYWLRILKEPNVKFKYDMLTVAAEEDSGDEEVIMDDVNHDEEEDMDGA